MNLGPASSQIQQGKWQLRKLGDLAQILDHLRVPVNSEERDKRLGDVPYYGANGIQGYIDKALFDEPLVLLAEDGGNFDQFFSRPIAYRIEGPSWVNNHAHILRSADSSVVLSFLFHALEHRDIRRYISGGTRGKLTQAELCSIEVLTPPTAEQARIAEVLDTLDEAIRRTEQVIGKSMSVRQGLLQDLLTLGINENGELRDSHRESFSPSPIGSIPSTWQARQVGSLLQGIEQGWSPDCEAEPAESGAWGVLKTTAVVWDGYQDHENKALPSHLRPRPELEVRCGDVLMTRGGPNSRVGVVARVEFTQGRLMLSDKLYRLVPKDEIGNAFLALALSGSRTQIHLSRLKTGLAESQTNISQAIVRALLIPLPPVEEQERIVTCYSATVKRITEDQGLLHRLRALKAGLASDLLTGHVRVTTGAPA